MIRNEMKIALIGYGKMGKLLEAKALEKGFSITAIVDSKNSLKSKMTRDALLNADVCIDFSTPDAVLENIKALAPLKKNIVMGTTGWLDKEDEIKALVEKHRLGFIYASNFSIGVALFSSLVEQAAKIFLPFKQYEARGFEIHHNKKLDAPSGTAKSLADIVNKERSTDFKKNKPITFSSIRVGHVPGTHTLLFDSEVDTIELTHIARNREGFAEGALLAAEWIQNKIGLFTINDLINEIHYDRF